MSTIHTEDKSFQLLQGESLLEGLERTGHEVEYQCRSGYCGACRLTLVAGSVIYREAPLAHVGHSEILPCCCSVTEPIRIECQAGRQGELPVNTDQYELSL